MPAENFLFLGSEAGGERAGILYNVLGTAKLNRLKPEAYLADVIDRLDKGHSINRLGELLPWKRERPGCEIGGMNLRFQSTFLGHDCSR